MLTKLRNKVADNKILKNILFWANCVLLFAYTFSILVFSLLVPVICYVSMALLIAFAFLYLLLYPTNLFLQKRNFIILFFLISAFISTALYSRRWREYLTIFLMVGTFFTLLASLLVIEKRNLIFLILVAAFFIFSIIFIIYFRYEIAHYRQYTHDQFRLGPPFENQNAVGNYMAIAIIITIYLILFNKNKLYWLLVIPLIVFFFIGFTTGSRTFLVLSALSVAALIFFRFRKKWWVVLIALAGSAALLIVLINFVPIFSSIKYRIEDTLSMFTNGLSAGSTLERIVWQQYGVYLASRRILFGYGDSGFAAASGVNTYTHGNFSEVLCDFGIVGFIGFYMLLIMPFLYAIKMKNDEKYFVLTMVIIMMVNGFMTVFYYDKSTYIIFALIYFAVSKEKLDFNLGRKVVVQNEANA